MASWRKAGEGVYKAQKKRADGSTVRVYLRRTNLGYAGTAWVLSWFRTKGKRVLQSKQLGVAPTLARAKQIGARALY